MAVIFTTLTVGVNITKHYSGDKLYSISVNGEAKSCCEVPCDCCSDESEFFQLKGDYLLTGYLLQHEYYAVDIIHFSMPIAEIGSLSLENEIGIYKNRDYPLPESKDYLSMIQAFLL